MNNLITVKKKFQKSELKQKLVFRLFWYENTLAGYKS